MAKATRDQVFSVVSDGRVFQDRKLGTVEQRPHEVGGWLTLMRKLLTDAEVAWAGSDGDYKSLLELRKVLAVGVACAEQHGLPAAADAAGEQEDAGLMNKGSNG